MSACSNELSRRTTTTINVDSHRCSLPNEDSTTIHSNVNLNERTRLKLNCKTKMKKLLRKMKRRNSHLKTDVKLAHVWYGNDYGGFYVAPNFLNAESIVYSFGIGEDISFDTDILRNHSCSVFGFDPTPKSIRWINDQDLPEGFVFHDCGLDSKSGTAIFYLPENDAHVSGSVIQQNNVSAKKAVDVKMKSFSDIASSLEHTRVDLLKMDIEGSEYSVIDSLISSNLPIVQICVEFHDRFFPEPKESIEAIKKLRAAGFRIFAVSKSHEEISLIHQDYCH